MKKWLHFITLVGVYHIYPGRKIKERIRNSLLSRFGIFVRFNRLKLRGFNSIQFKGVEVMVKKMPAISVTSDAIGFSFTLKFLKVFFAGKRSSENGTSRQTNLGRFALTVFKRVEVSNLVVRMQYRGVSGALTIERFIATPSRLEILSHLNLNRVDISVLLTTVKEEETIRIIPRIIHSNVFNDRSVGNISIELKKGTGTYNHLSFQIDRISIRDSRLSPSAVLIRKLVGDIHFTISNKQFRLLNDSKITINDCIDAYPVFTYNISTHTAQGSLLIDVDAAPFIEDAADFGLELCAVAANGNMLLQISAQCYLSHLSIDHLEISILNNEISFTDYGDLPVRKLHGDGPVFSRHGGTGFVSENLGTHQPFVSFEDFPEKYKALVVLAEDPEFYFHKGVAVGFMQIALNTNLKKRSFSRGASTITMQLTRNLFLNMEKTLCRKGSEVILALIIENYLLVSKERILEIYLNIIEFGNGVYGSFNASYYYFGKPLQSLSLSELFTLIYIIPRPKHFDNALRANSETLRRNLKSFIHSFSAHAVSKNIITAQDSACLWPQLAFSNHQILDLQ